MKVEMPVIRASKIQLSHILPSPDDIGDLYDRFLEMIKRSLVECVPCFGDCKQALTEHLPHEYSDEMTSKSEVVCLNMYVLKS